MDVMYWFQSRGRFSIFLSVAAHYVIFVAGVFFLSSTSGASGTSATAALSPESKRPDLSGLYASSNGIKATVYQPTNQQPWVIRTIYADGTPVTLYLDGSADSLVPSGMDTEIMVGGESVKIVARGRRLYAAKGSPVAGMECYLDESGRMKTIRAGKLDDGSSSESTEARMAISKVVDDWSMIRRQVVRLGKEGMRVVNADAPGDSELNQFTRVSDLDSGDASRLQEMQEASRANLDRVADFEVRLRKAELRN